MSAGDTVTVYDLAAPELRGEAEVVLASPNDNSLALAFHDKPPFAWGEPPLGFPVHPDYGAMLLLLRDATSQPFWIDLFTGKRFNVEAV